jgi:hypothetical protein
LKFSLYISVKDEEHLDSFITTIGANLDEKKRRVLGKYKSPVVGISICNRIFCENLVLAGCFPAKTKRLRFPKLLEVNLQLAMLLGYFDGDGTLCGPQHTSPVVTCGSYEFLEDVIEVFKIQSKLRDLKSYWRLCLGVDLLRRMTSNYHGGLLRKRMPQETPLISAS